jgi:hypothetical protein
MYYGFGLHSRSTTVFSTKVFVKTTGFRNVTPCTMLPEIAASQPTKRTNLLGHRWDNMKPRKIFVGFVYPNRSRLDNRKILCLWNVIQLELRAKSFVHKERRISCIGYKVCVYFQREKTEIFEHYAFIWHRLHDGQKGPKHAADDKWPYSVLRVLFALKINTDINISWGLRNGRTPLILTLVIRIGLALRVNIFLL